MGPNLAHQTRNLHQDLSATLTAKESKETPPKAKPRSHSIKIDLQDFI